MFGVGVFPLKCQNQVGFHTPGFPTYLLNNVCLHAQIVKKCSACCRYRAMVNHLKTFETIFHCNMCVQIVKFSNLVFPNSFKITEVVKPSAFLHLSTKTKWVFPLKGLCKNGVRQFRPFLQPPESPESDRVR